MLLMVESDSIQSIIRLTTMWLRPRQMLSPKHVLAKHTLRWNLCQQHHAKRGRIYRVGIPKATTLRARQMRLLKRVLVKNTLRWNVCQQICKVGMMKAATPSSKAQRRTKELAQHTPRVNLPQQHHAQRKGLCKPAMLSSKTHRLMQ
jgi:hypothetical protein